MSISKAWSAVPVGLALLAAGCGSNTTDVSAGTADVNRQLEPQGVSLECPKEVSGGEGTEFECTMKGAGDKSKLVKMKIVKDGEDLAVDVANQTEFDSAIKEVSGG